MNANIRTDQEIINSYRDYLEVERSGLSVEISKLKKEGIIYTNKNYFELLPSHWYSHERNLGACGRKSQSCGDV